MNLLVSLLLSLGLSAQTGQPPLIPARPPMGWNSYDCFGDSVTEAEVMANATYMRRELRRYGWNTVVVDYRWYDPGAHDNNANGRARAPLTMDSFGRLLPATNRFPSAQAGNGFKPLADRLHRMGLKFGIHIMRGIPRLAADSNALIEGSSFHATNAVDRDNACSWCADMFGVKGDTPAGQAYYDSIFRLYASWNVDYVKMDDASQPYRTAEIEAVRKAIDRCGRPIVFSLSPGETPISEAGHVASHANMWRVSGDFWDEWQPLRHSFLLAERWQGKSQPRHWPDYDMLPFGHLSVKERSVGPDRQTRFTRDEQMTVMTLWSIMGAPLMVGANLPDNDPWTTTLLTNRYVLAVDQDPVGKPAIKLPSAENTEIWTKELANGDRAIGLFNTGEVEGMVPLPPFASGASILDAWRGESLTIGSNRSLKVPPHGARLLIVSKR